MTALATTEEHDFPSIFDEVGSFTTTAEGLADLGLHRQVNETVDVLLAETRFYNGMIGTGAALISRIREEKPAPEAYLDPNGDLEESLLAIADRYESYLSRMTAKKGCIDGDNRLSESHCDMLHSAYDDELVALACFIETVKDMAAAISRHDLIASPRNVAVHESVQDLRAAILS